MRLFSFVLLLSVVCWAAPLQADAFGPVALSRLNDSDALSRAIRVVHDPTGALTPLEAIHQATARGQGVESVDHKGKGYWLVVPLNNDTAHTQWWYSNYNTFYSSLDVYLVADGAVRATYLGGRKSAPINKHLMLFYGWHFPFELDQGESVSLAIYIQGSILNSPIMELHDAQAAKLDHLLRQYSIILMLGMIIALIVYNLMLSAAVKDIAYLWYGLHGLFLVFWFSNTTGILHTLNFPDVSLHWQRTSFVGHELFAVLFCYRFLNISGRSRGLRLVFQLLIGLLALSMSALLLRPADPAQGGIPLLGLLLMLLAGSQATLLLFTGIQASWNGYRPARYFVLGWSGFSLMTIVGVLSLMGVITTTSNTLHGLIAASAFEMLMLALALAARIRQLQLDKGAAEAANEEQNAFIANVSHELRTPLHGILGLSRLLASTTLDAEQKKSVAMITRTGNALLGLINNILDYTRLTTHGMAYRADPFAPGELAVDLVSLLAVDAQDKGISLSCHVDAEVPPVVSGDQDRVRQVLLNLLSNAVKFTDHGSVTIEVSVLSRSQEAIELRYAVKDTGIGIPPALRERLFQRFSQADARMGRRFGGTGLGLAICKELAEGMGGRVHFTSAAKGTTFYFDLPLGRCEVALPPNPPRSEKPAKDLALLRDRRLLIVDDVPLNLFILEQSLKDSGSLVDLSDSGRDAVVKAGNQHYALILIDINMPEMDGIAATQAIRAHHDPEVAATPIIGVTASVLPKERQLYIERGMNAVLAKPYTQDDLARVIRQVLERETEPVVPHTSGHTPPTQALLDDEYLVLQQQDMGIEAQRALFGQFREQGRRYLDDAEQALASNAAQLFREHLHRLRGMASMCGCIQLAEATSRLEHRSEEHRPEEHRPKGQSSREACEADLAQLRQLFEQSADALLATYGDHRARRGDTPVKPN